MLIADVKKLSPIETLVYWVKERHAIYLKKEAGKPKPWTDDEILQNYFFTCPYRENDKTTKWFRENIRDPLSESMDVIFATIAFRWFNYIPTGEILMDVDPKTGYDFFEQWDTREVIKILTKRQEEGHKIFTGAFTISPSGSSKPKVERVCEDYIDDVWRGREKLIAKAETWKTMQEAHRDLSKYPGLAGSGFMAYEIVCDLRYTRFLEAATDKMTWSNPGPGAKRGINRLLGRDLTIGVPDYQQRSAEILKILNSHKSLKGMPRFEMREVEHSLCEMDKYLRALTNDGHMKRRYKEKK